ncbi:MAG: 4Fe-4S dicluster domain-containing protein, partial [bacterium]
CTKSCPQNIQVMDAINTILRGDIAKAAYMTFDCIMCGMCTARCPAEIVHYNVFILVQRLYGSKLAPPSKELQQRIKELEEGKFAEEINQLLTLSKEELKQLYKQREIEPEEE